MARRKKAPARKKEKKEEEETPVFHDISWEEEHKGGKEDQPTLEDEVVP